MLFEALLWDRNTHTSYIFLKGKGLHDIFHSKKFVEAFIKASFLFKKIEVFKEKKIQDWRN